MLQPFSNNSIDWGRLAEPQADQYDSDVVLELASSTTSAGRSQFYRRSPVGDSPTVFGGQVAVRYVYRSLPEFASLSTQFQDAPVDHPNIRMAAEYVRCWPVGYAQCLRLLEAIHPAMDPRIPLESIEVYRGSACHSYEQLFGTMWTTIFCPIGLAEAIVHEMAHQKLRALGVSFESAKTVVGNDGSDLYVSPIIKDRLRPMTAVLHAEYSYVYVTTLDIHILKAERDESRKTVIAGVLERNLSRIKEGYETIRKHFKTGQHGTEFIKGLSTWIDNTITLAEDTLRCSAKPDSVSASANAIKASNNSFRPAVQTPTIPTIEVTGNTIHAADREVNVIFTLRSPSIMLVGNLLSDEECDALVGYSEPRLVRSSVVADAQGNVQVHSSRTSLGVMLRQSETPLIARIEHRLAALAKWPLDCAEGLQILRYGTGEEYRPHFDWMDPSLPGLRKHLQAGGQRLATFVLYLSKVESGGYTAFPSVGLEIMPQKGSAVFFLNTNSDHTPDELTLHAGSPVTGGVKFVANKWLRQYKC